MCICIYIYMCVRSVYLFFYIHTDTCLVLSQRTTTSRAPQMLSYPQCTKVSCLSTSSAVRAMAHDRHRNDSTYIHVNIAAYANTPSGEHLHMCICMYIHPYLHLCPDLYVYKCVVYLHACQCEKCHNCDPHLRNPHPSRLHR